MPKFNVSCDLLVPVLVEIEAGTADEAADKLCEMPNTELLRLANTENSAIAIHDGSITVDMDDHEHTWRMDADNIEVCEKCGEERGELR